MAEGWRSAPVRLSHLRFMLEAENIFPTRWIASNLKPLASNIYIQRKALGSSRIEFLSVEICVVKGYSRPSL